MERVRLSLNFYLDEFVHSRVAAIHGIDNTPPDWVVDNLQRLCDNVLQPLRDLLGVPIHITSGYRCERLNELIGGARHSQHLYGEASDIVVYSVPMADVLHTIAEALPFDQLIWEFGGQWIHVSYTTRWKLRRQILQSIRTPDGVRYIELNPSEV